MNIQELLDANPTDHPLDGFEMYIKDKKNDNISLIARVVFHFPNDEDPFVVLEQE